MRQVVAIFLLFILMFPLAMKMGVIAYFKIEQKEITEKYCVNKDKPEMHCNGKCHLKEQLQKVEEEPLEQKSPLNTTTIFKIELLPFCINNTQSLLSSNIYGLYHSASYGAYLSPFYLKQYLHSKFHPPEYI